MVHLMKMVLGCCVWSRVAFSSVACFFFHPCPPLIYVQMLPSLFRGFEGRGNVTCGWGCMGCNLPSRASCDEKIVGPVLCHGRGLSR